MADTNFNDLLNAAELLAADTDGCGDLPKWNRTIYQLAEAAEEMWSRLGSKAAGQENQANALLAPKGIDIPLMTQKLRSLSTRKTFLPSEPATDIDVRSFLKNEYENGVLSIITVNEKVDGELIRIMTWNHCKKVWHEVKKKLTSPLLGFNSSPDLLHTEESCVQEVSSGRSMLSQLEIAYAKQVIEYNRVVMSGLERPNLIEGFLNTAVGFNDKSVQDLWEMVKYMSNIPPVPCGDALEARCSKSIQNVFISQAKKYLEERYKSYMTSVVSGNMERARRTGVPDTYDLVKSYVSIIVTPGCLGLEDGLLEGQPVWPLIYYCLRCGDATAALYVSRQAESALAEFSSLLEKMSESPNGKLSSRLEHIVKAQYRRYTRNTTDPYKRAVYCVVGSCDVNDEHKEISRTTDDYLWLKLSQIREEDNAETIGERMSFSHLQSLILEEYGERYYKADQQPHIYFQALTLTGQFEAALEFLSRIEKLRVHSVHIAIALHELGLLADSSTVNSPLLTISEKDKPPARRLNFVRLISQYVRPFQISDPHEALHYFYFLRHISNHANENMFTICVSDLVIEGREFDLILGRMEPDGCRTPGLIDSFRGLKQSTNDIIRHVASECEKRGNIEDAINVIDLANDHEEVLCLLNMMLTQVLTMPNKPGSLRFRMQTLSHSVSVRWRGQEFTCSAETASTFFILRDLMSFFDEYNAGHYTEALELINRSKLLPAHKGEVSEHISNFKKLNDQIKRHFADIMLATMSILQHEYNKLKNSGTENGVRFEGINKEKQQLPSYIREKAQAITNFAGCLDYRMRGDTISKLVQMEILMH